MSYDIKQGHVLDVLRTMLDESVHCIITSPPYWGLRDYGLPPIIWGGKKDCRHEWADENVIREIRTGLGMSRLAEKYRGGGRKASQQKLINIHRGKCIHCSGWRGSLGLEPTPELYIEHLVMIFRELRRVLRKDGTLWLNIGDSYWGGKGQSSQAWSTNNTDRDTLQKPYHQIATTGQTRPQDGKHDTIKAKDLVGIPWMLAFALRADGWYVRQDIIWHKPNPMPESVSDRCTKSHEYIFLLTKSGGYYFDQEAIKEPATYPGDDRKGRASEDHKRMPSDSVNGIRPRKAGKNAMRGQGSNRNGNGAANRDGRDMNVFGIGSMRNRRSVWTIATKPYREAHFATFPEELVQPCIAAGTSERGCCPSCGAPWEKVVKPSERYAKYLGKSWTDHNKEQDAVGNMLAQLRGSNRRHQQAHHEGVYTAEYITVGWQPTCTCDVVEPVPCNVLDPFSGSGTTVAVAHKMGRHGIGIELNHKYIKLAERRIEKAGILL